MFKSKWVAALLIAALVIVSGYVLVWIRPYLIGKYGLDPAIVAGLFIVAEALFDLSLAMMLWFSGIKPNWSNIKSLKIKKFRVAKNPGAMIGLSLNRIAWIMPFMYIAIIGWFKLPWFITALVLVEIAITAYVGLLIVGLFDNKRKLIIRPATPDDLDGVVDVDQIAWGDTFPGTREMFAQRISNFPEGGVVVAEYCGKIVATLSLQLLEKDDLPPLFTWNSITGDGTLNGTHNSQGKWVYGLGLASTPEGSKLKATEGLFYYAGRYIIGNNKKGVILMARMPGYHKFAGKMQPEEYVLAERNGKPLDPELRIYKGGLMSVMKPVVIVEDYMTAGSDPDSRGYSVMVGWTNPFYGKPFSQLWARLLRL